MNDIDALWAKIDEDPTILKPGDIDTLVTYFRSLRGQKESGGFKRAKKDPGPTNKIDLAALGLIKAPAPTGDFKRRV